MDFTDWYKFIQLCATQDTSSKQGYIGIYEINAFQS